MKKLLKRYILLLCCVVVGSLYAQAQQLISGKVTDNNGAILSGVIITQNGNPVTAETDQKGNFTLSVSKLPASLSFVLPGYNRSHSSYVKAQNNAVIVMEKTVYQPVAYGEQSKHSVTASTYTISGEELVATRATSLLIALQGKLPGLRVIETDGEPGRESFDSHVRGYNSPNSNGTIYYVDGVERYITGVDLNEVESVTILKDAAATSIYGMRGSAGVIIITTKKGLVGKTKINVSIDHSMASPTRLPHTVSAYDYAKMFNQRRANDTLYADAQGSAPITSGPTGFYSDADIQHYQLGDSTQFYPNRNMLSEFLNDYMKVDRVNVIFQGGSKLMRYFTSLGFTSQGSIFANEDFPKYSYDAASSTKRFNFRNNLEVTLNPNLEAWLNVGGYIQNINAPFVGAGLGWNDLINKLYLTPNNAFNNLTPTGEVLINRSKMTNSNTQSIYGMMNRTGYKRETITRLSNTFGFRQKLDKLLPGLSATGQFAFDINSSNLQLRSRSYQTWEVVTLKARSGVDSLGYATVPGSTNSGLSDGQNTSFYYMYDMRAMLNYNRDFGKHSVTGMLLGERYMQQSQTLLPSNYLNLASRFTYAYDNRYFVEANASYQGNEQFVKGKRFGLFPSLSLGWVLSEEKFLNTSKTISFLKLRASAGQSGNTVYDYSTANQYLFLSSWDANGNEVKVGNPNISWETSTKYNIGVETEFFKSLTFQADLFYNKNTDIVVNGIAIIPTGFMGLTTGQLPPANLGDNTNKGFEVAVGYNKKINKDLSVSVGSNMSYSQNKRGFMAEFANDSTFAYKYRQQGYSINQFWGYRTAGLFNTQDEINAWPNQSPLGGKPIPGDIKYVDLNKDGIVDQRDQAPLGEGQAPNISFGFNVQVNYKGFDMNMFFNGSARRNIFLNGFGRWSNQDNFTEYMKNAWTPDKVGTGVPIVYPRLGTNSTNNIMSDYWINDGSYLRLRNIEIGYSLPQKIAKIIDASSIRFYANGLNLFVWDRLPTDDFDPEASAGNTTYPVLKAYNFGVSVKF